MLNHPMLLVRHLYTIIFRDFLKSKLQVIEAQNIQWWPFAEIIDTVQSFEIESTNDKNATSVLYILTLSFNLKWFFLKTFFLPFTVLFDTVERRILEMRVLYSTKMIKKNIYLLINWKKNW